MPKIAYLVRVLFLGDPLPPAAVAGLSEFTSQERNRTLRAAEQSVNRHWQTWATFTVAPAIAAAAYLSIFYLHVGHNYYFVPLVTVSACIAAGVAQRTRRRYRDGALLDRFPGRCDTCGYDLRATPNQCPECGRVERGQ